MKLLQFSVVHPAYAREFYARNPELAKKSFAEQKSILDYDASSWADFWSHSLAPFGYETLEVNVNIAPLQRAWAKENAVSFPKNTWLSEIPYFQARKFQPDILFLADRSSFNLQWLQTLRENCPSIKLILAWCGGYYRDTDIFKEADVLLSCNPALVKKCNDGGLRSYHLHHAFEPRILTRLKSRSTKRIPFSFIGQIMRGKHLHNEREELLKALRKKMDLHIYTPQEPPLEQWKSFARKYAFGVAQNLKSAGFSNAVLNQIPILKRASNWDELPPHLDLQELKPCIRGTVFGLAMFQTLRNSDMTLNNHSDSETSASNMRMFEATGVGTCLVTDWKKDLSELFEPDKEVVTYRSVDECVEKVQWLQSNETEREKISALGQQRTLQHHTFSHRAAQLDEIIQQFFSAKMVAQRGSR
jgi:spore maturation protein CgeB